MTLKISKKKAGKQANLIIITHNNSSQYLNIILPTSKHTGIFLKLHKTCNLRASLNTLDHLIGFPLPPSES